MRNEDIEKLFNTKMDSLEELMIEKIEHNRDYVGGRLDEVIRQQKVANGSVNKLKEESELCKIHRTEGAVRARNWGTFRKFLYVIIPCALFLMGLSVRDHFKLEGVEGHIENVQAELILYVEAKSRAYESMSKGNYESIIDLDAAQEKLDSFLIDKYKVRSLRENTLPEF